MIKDEKKGGDIADNSVLKELGINSNKLVENEIEVLRSYDLMEEVVKREKLYVSYSVEGRIRDIPLYGTAIPFQLQVLSPDSIVGLAKWTVSLAASKFNVTSGKQTLNGLGYGNIYSLNGLRFRFMPNETYPAPGGSLASVQGTFFVDILPVNYATGLYNGKLLVAPVSKQASVVNLSINDEHIERARDVLATLIDIYNSQSLDDKNKVTSNTIDFLNDRLKSVARDLQGVEGQVEQFKSDHNITDISSDAQQFMDMAKSIDLSRAESQTRMNIVAALENDLVLNQDNPGLVPSSLGIEESSLNSLIEKHNTLILQKERAEKNPEIGPKNPLIVDLQTQVREARKKLLENVRNLKQAYQIALDDVSRRDEQLKGRIRNMPQLERKLVEIKRNQNVEESLYAFLLQKREEAAVTLASNIPDSRTIVKSRGLGAVSPSSKIIWMIALLVGLLTPFIIMMVVDFFNTKVGDSAEVEQKADVPLLGVISHIKKISSPIVITEKSRSVVAEQIRTLRTAIGFTGKGREVKKILITSSQPGDGKSFVSLNLAASYALLGKKTVLVELDLRKPHVGKYIGVQAQHGISGILAGKMELDKVLIKVPNFDHELYLLPAGYLPPNPSELISTANMEQMVADLTERFDYIIIDTPPFGLVTDAVLLQKYVDITLAVLRQGHTSKDVYDELNQRRRQKPDYPMYAVLNGVGRRKRYQQGYGYGKYGYGYNKGYFEEE
jgi:capsular exopolysaccharide synthesis family protein